MEVELTESGYGYEWRCLACGHTNEETEAADTVQCERCRTAFDAVLE